MAAGGRGPSSSGQVDGGEWLLVARRQRWPGFIKPRLFLCTPDSCGDAGSEGRMGPGSRNQITSVCLHVQLWGEFAEVSCI